MQNFDNKLSKAQNSLKNINFLYRKLDQNSWKFCNKGFFNFKNYIPKIVENLIN